LAERSSSIARVTRLRHDGDRHTRPKVDAPTKRDLATALNGIDNHDAKTLTRGQALENCVAELQGRSTHGHRRLTDAPGAVAPGARVS
jgi:hypothetical protein